MRSFFYFYFTYFRCGFGVHIEEQMKALDNMEKFLDDFRVKGKLSPQPWQDGVRISIKSTKSLYKDLILDKNVNHDGSLKYILTHRLNQDLLENLFSRLRGLGGANDHPGPVLAMRRLRILQLSKCVNAEILVNNPSVKIQGKTIDYNQDFFNRASQSSKRYTVSNKKSHI